MHRALVDIRSQLPSGLEAHPLRRQRVHPGLDRRGVHDLVEAVLIVLVVIFLSLGSCAPRWCPGGGAAVTGRCGVPDAAARLSINLLTLLAMVLAIGLVVDDAIVVVENVHRHIEMGKSRQDGDRRRARTRPADHRHDHHPGGGVCADRLHGRPGRHPVHRVRLLAGRCGADLRRGRADAVADAVAAVLRPAGSRVASSVGRALLRGLANGSTCVAACSLATLPATLLFGVAVLAQHLFHVRHQQSELARPRTRASCSSRRSRRRPPSLEYNEPVRGRSWCVRAVPEYHESFLLLGFGGDGNVVFGGFKMDQPSKRERSQMECCHGAGRPPDRRLPDGGVSAPQPARPGRGLPFQFVVLATPIAARSTPSPTSWSARGMGSGQFLFLRKSIEFRGPRRSW